MTTYTVSCYSPPAALKIKNKDTVQVEGLLNKKTKNILASSIKNLAESGPICRCGTPKITDFLPSIPQYVTKTGTVKNYTIGGQSIQFELETTE